MGACIVPVGMGGTPAALPKGKKLPRRTRVRVVVGTPISPPDRSEGGRVPRSALRQMTEELQKQLQALYDDAEGRA
jgi:1-acyl-sn-glycerol-3-phosphate acyltransferase